MLEDLKPILNDLGEKLDQMRISLEIPAKEEKIAELEYKMGEPSFWDDAAAAQKLNQELAALKGGVDTYRDLKGKYEDAETLYEMGIEENDPSMESDIRAELTLIAEGLETLQLEVLLSGDYDANDAILTLHAGAGGTEAQDWTQMLLRMYGRWAERHGFTVETADLQPGDELGRELGVARPVAPAQGVAQAHRRALQLPFDAAAPAPLEWARTAVPDLGEGLADLLEDVPGLDSGERGQKGPDVPRRPGGPEVLRVEALGIHVAEVHDEGGRLLPDGPLLLRRQGCIGLLVAVAPVPSVLVGQAAPAPDGHGLGHDDAVQALRVPEAGHGAPAGPLVREVEDVAEHVVHGDVLLDPLPQVRGALHEDPLAEVPGVDHAPRLLVGDAGAVRQGELPQVGQVPAAQGAVDGQAQLVEGRRGRQDEVAAGRRNEGLPEPE